MHLRHHEKTAEPEKTTEQLLLEAVQENNRLLKLNVNAQTQFRWRFFAGLATGFGTVVGATVVIAIIVRLLAGLATVDRIGPYVRDLQEMLERPAPGTRNRQTTPAPTVDDDATPGDNAPVR